MSRLLELVIVLAPKNWRRKGFEIGRGLNRIRNLPNRIAARARSAPPKPPICHQICRQSYILRRVS
jgi:hypothetical protein